MLANPISGLFGRSKGARKADKVHNEFHATRGYGAYHDYCRQQSNRELGPATGDLFTAGFEKIPVMPSDDASRLLKQVLDLDRKSVV